MSIGQHDSRPRTCARILHVDDNAFGLSARKTILEELGYSVVAKSCPCLALECFSGERFDMVITDFRMPRMDGTALIAELRKRRSDIPVVLISGFVDTLGLDEPTTGANAVIQKSAHEVHIMLRTVERLLAGKPPKKASGGSAPVARAAAAR